MTYDEIMNISDFNKKEEELIKYYKNEISVLDWLKPSDNQTIFFKDRLELKENNKLHSISKPAIKYKDGSEYFYIHGKLYTEKLEWEKDAKKIKRLSILNKVLD